jgi:hypothetical protein
MAEVEGEGGLVRCERCGALRPASGCGCGGQGRGGGRPTVPEGWDPELTRSARPRLRIVLALDQASGDGPDPTSAGRPADGPDPVSAGSPDPAGHPDRPADPGAPA